MALINTSVGPERVEVIPQPLGTVPVPGASLSTAAFLISTAFVGAPVNAPTRVSTFEEFVEAFGDADDIANDGYYHVQGWYDNAGQGAQAIIVNVGTTPTASSYIGSAALGTGLRALDALDDSMLVMIPGLPLSTAYAVHSSLIDYTETVRADFGSTLSTSFSLLSPPKQVSLANKEQDVTTTLFVSVSGSGPYVLTVEDTLGGGTADLSDVTPGMIVQDDALSFTAVVVAVDDGADTITIATDPAGTWSGGDNIHVRIPSAVTYKETVINNPSKTAAWYFNHLNVSDASATPGPSGIVSVDPVGHAAGVWSRIGAQTSIGGVSHAPAGIQFAGLAGIQGLSFSISERLDAEPLRTSFINRIQAFPGSGNVIFGGYTADSGTSPAFTAQEQLIQVIRTVQFIKASLEPGLRSFIWENQDPETQSRVNSAITSFLRNNSYLFPRGLPESSKFKVISVDPTQDELDQGLLRVRVQVKPNSAVRFIEIALEFPIPTT